MVGDINMIDGGQSLAAENHEAELSRSKCHFCQGVSGISGLSCWASGYQDFLVGLVVF